MSTSSAPRRALIVYETMFSNTEIVAGAIAEGLREEGYDATLADVRWADLLGRLDVELLVLGAPTHAFSLSRPATRQDAVRQGASQSRMSTGIREWLGALDRGDGRAMPAVAAFDTRVARARRLPAASGRISRAARRLGFRVITHPEGFLVEDTKGPLVDGEVDRATTWGRTLARLERGTKGPALSAPCP